MKKLVLILVLVLIVVGVVFALKPMIESKSAGNGGEAKIDYKPAEKVIKNDFLKQEDGIAKRIKLTTEQRKLYRSCVDELAKELAVVVSEQAVEKAKLEAAKSPDLDKVMAEYTTKMNKTFDKAMEPFHKTLSEQQMKDLIQYRLEMGKADKK